MAPRQAAALSADQSEREYQTTLNNAVAATEDEIFADALGDDELENDGDTSLEEMGDGLEGEVVADDDAGEEADESEGDEGEEAKAEGEEGDGEEPEPEPDRARDGRFQRQEEGRVPPGRLRQEAERARQAEERALMLERGLAEMQGRFAEMSARINAPQPKAAVEDKPPPKPDMFTDPVGYEQWVTDQAVRRAEDAAQKRFDGFQQQQQARDLQRVDYSLAQAARGPRGFEFTPAYNTLTSLDPRNPNAQQLVRSIMTAPNPGQALLEWWDQTELSAQYREQILEQLAPAERPAAPQRGRAAPEPRHEIRPPTRRLPSLNSATGSNSQRVSDPEMLDGSDRSIFNYATRR